MDLRVPPIVEQLRNVSHRRAWDELLEFFASGRADRFRVFIDDACALPADWRSEWDAPQQWGSLGNGNWATKYAAAGFIPHMIEQSPFVTTDWREADASVVVLFPRHFAGGPTILQQQCLLRLQSRSAAFQAHNGSRHFFIFVDSRGPCCLDGKYKDVAFRGLHVIGPHGEPATSKPWFRLGSGPPLTCFDAAKDIGIPTPNIHFPRTRFAKRLPTVLRNGTRPLLLFYAGWNYDTRMKLVNHFANDPDPELLVRREIASSQYPHHMMSARFCPVCGGFSQWTPRLAEALYYECVPIILSDQLLPPLSGLLDWSTFSARLPAGQVGRLKGFARSLDHGTLLAGVRRARDALMYKLNGYRGDDLLPLLLFEMWRKVAAGPPRAPDTPIVRQLWNTVEADRDYDAGAAKDSHLGRDVPVTAPTTGGRFVETHAALEIVRDALASAGRHTGRGGGGGGGRGGGGRATQRTGVAVERWFCSSFNGYDCRCETLRGDQLAVLLQIVASAGAGAWRDARPVSSVAETWARIIQQVRSTKRFGPLLHGPTFLKSARAIKLNLEQLVTLPIDELQRLSGHAPATLEGGGGSAALGVSTAASGGATVVNASELALRIRAIREDAISDGAAETLLEEAAGTGTPPEHRRSGKRGKAARADDGGGVGAGGMPWVQKKKTASQQQGFSQEQALSLANGPTRGAPNRHAKGDYTRTPRGGGAG